MGREWDGDADYPPGLTEGASGRSTLRDWLPGREATPGQSRTAALPAVASTDDGTGSLPVRATTERLIIYCVKA